MKKIFKIKTVHCLIALVAMVIVIYIADIFTTDAVITPIHDTHLSEVSGQLLKDETSDGISYVLFYKDGSLGCDRMAHNLDQFSKEKPDIRFLCMDISEEDKLLETYGISGVPYTLIFKDGKPVEKVMGIVSVANLGMIHNRVK